MMVKDPSRYVLVQLPLERFPPRQAQVLLSAEVQSTFPRNKAHKLFITQSVTMLELNFSMTQAGFRTAIQSQ